MLKYLESLTHFPQHWGRSLLVPDRSEEGAPGLCVVTIISDNFIGLGATFLASLMENGGLPEDAEILLLCDPAIAPLSEANRDLLRKICPRIRIEEPGSDHVTAARMKPRPGVRTADADLPSKKAAYLKLCILKQTRYRRVLWLDSDMLVLRPLTEILAQTPGIGVVRPGVVQPEAQPFTARLGDFNAGFILLPRPLLGEATFRAAERIMDRGRRSGLRDQPILNTLFRFHRKDFLSHKYNWKLNKPWSASEADMAMEQAHIVHFLAKSKWCLNKEERTDALSRYFQDMRKKHDIPLVIKP